MSINRAHTPDETNTCRPGCSVGDICCPLCSTTRIEIVDHDPEKIHFRVHPFRVFLINAAVNCPPSLCFCVPCTFSVDDWELKSDNTANVQRRYCFHTTTSTFANIDRLDVEKMSFVRTDGSVVDIQSVRLESVTERKKLNAAVGEFYENNPDAFNKTTIKPESSTQSPSLHSQTPQSPQVNAAKQQEKRLSSTPIPPALRRMYPGLSDAAIWEKIMDGRTPAINSSTSAARTQITGTQPETVDISNPINAMYENNIGIGINQAEYSGNAASTYQFPGFGVSQASSFSSSNHLVSTYDSTADKSNYFEVEATCGSATNFPSSQYSETAYNSSNPCDTSTFELSTTSVPAYNSQTDNIRHLWL